MIIHTARGGESPHDIARKYSVPLTKLLADNRHGGRLAEGEELLVLMPTKTAIVAGNDTRSGFARRHGITTGMLVAQNPQLAAGHGLQPGSVLAVKQHNLGLGAATAVGITCATSATANLECALPYLTYVVICAAEISEKGDLCIRDASGIVGRCIAEGKLVLLGIRDKGCGAFLDHRCELIENAIKACREFGAHGVCIMANEAAKANPEGICEFLLEVRRRFIGCELMLFSSLDGSTCPDAAELSDGAVFTSGASELTADRNAMEKLADSSESSKIFVDMPSVARIGSREITVGEALELCRRRAEPIRRGDDLMMRAECRLYRGGKGEHAEISFPSLEYVKAKLVLLAELGYAGISVDIDRLDLRLLTMFNAAFRRADYEFGEMYGMYR